MVQKWLRMWKKGRFQRWPSLYIHSWPWTLLSEEAGLSWTGASKHQQKEQGCVSSTAEGKDAGTRTSASYRRQWLTFITVTWRFLANIITNNARVFTVAAVVSSDIVFDTVGQGPLISCALHIIHVDGSFSFPEISHGSCSGRTPGSRAC